jgi:hypothetical protein
VRTLRIPRLVALGAIAFLVTAGILVSFMESYRALYWWASGHQVTGIWASVWPIQIDAFVAVGELALFVAMTDVWKVRHRSLPWAIAGAGLAVSIAGNVGHVVTTDIFTRVTAAVPPLTAYVMLAAGLGLLKRVIANQPAAETGPAKTVDPVRSARAKKGVETRRRRAERPSDSVPPTHVGPPVADPPPMATWPPSEGFTPPPAPEGWDPDSTGAFPRVGADGHPVAA